MFPLRPEGVVGVLLVAGNNRLVPSALCIHVNDRVQKSRRRQSRRQGDKPVGSIRSRERQLAGGRRWLDDCEILAAANPPRSEGIVEVVPQLPGQSCHVAISANLGDAGSYRSAAAQVYLTARGTQIAGVKIAAIKVNLVRKIMVELGGDLVILQGGGDLCRQTNCTGAVRAAQGVSGLPLRH